MKTSSARTERSHQLLGDDVEDAAAADLEFETAARLRDEVKRLRETELAIADERRPFANHALPDRVECYASIVRFLRARL